MLTCVPRFRECCRLSQAEVESKGSKKICHTWGPPPDRKGKKMHHVGLQQAVGWLAWVDTLEG